MQEVGEWSLSARVVSRAGRDVWLCPRCDRTLGEVYGDKVTVKAGDRLLRFPISADVEQTCPRCGAVSAVTLSSLPRAIR